MKTLEVRCCCKPEKLLGWVDVPDHMAHEGISLIASRCDPATLSYCDCSYTDFSLGRLPPVRITQVRFPMEMYVAGAWTQYLAVKAEGYEGAELETLLMPWRFRPARSQIVDVGNERKPA